MLGKQSRTKGFTVVELIVVIAVITILAAIVVMSFGKWRQQAANTEVKTALTSLASSLKNNLNFNSVYPTTAEGVPSSYQPSDGVTIDYTGTATTYCASGTSTADASIVWYISNTNQTPSKTAC